MEFPSCNVTAVKADIAAGKINLTFSMPLNADNLDTAGALALYVDKDAGKVEVCVIPTQLPLIPVSTQPEDWQAEKREPHDDQPEEN